MVAISVAVKRFEHMRLLVPYALLLGLIALVVLSRVMFASAPYYVDGPNQVAAITSGGGYSSSRPDTSSSISLRDKFTSLALSTPHLLLRF